MQLLDEPGNDLGLAGTVQAVPQTHVGLVGAVGDLLLLDPVRVVGDEPVAHLDDVPRAPIQSSRSRTETPRATARS